MKYVLLAAICLAAAVATSSYGSTSPHKCPSSGAKAFVAIQSDPAYIVGTIPSAFTSDQRFFMRRFNCLGQGAQVRRVTLGIYDVKFPGLNPTAVVSTAISDEAVTSSVEPLTDGIVRVALRGPLGGSDIASRRDVAFTVVVY